MSIKCFCDDCKEEIKFSSETHYEQEDNDSGVTYFPEGVISEDAHQWSINKILNQNKAIKEEIKHFENASRSLNYEGNLGETYYHPELYDNIPEVADVKFQRADLPSNVGGQA